MSCKSEHILPDETMNHILFFFFPFSAFSFPSVDVDVDVPVVAVAVMLPVLLSVCHTRQPKRKLVEDAQLEHMFVFRKT